VEKLLLERLPEEPPPPARAQALDSISTPIPKKSTMDNAIAKVNPLFLFKTFLLASVNPARTLPEWKIKGPKTLF